MLHPTQAPPFVLADGSKTKNGNVARQYIRPEIANGLKALASQKLVRANVFDLPERWEVADMFRLTLDRFVHPFLGSQAAVVAELRLVFSKPSKVAVTGTDGKSERQRKRQRAKVESVPVGATHCIREGKAGALGSERFPRKRRVSARNTREKKPTGPEGLEPPTYGLEIRCSIQLSYDPVFESKLSTSDPFSAIRGST